MNGISDTHEWRMLCDFKQGDFIHRWGDDLPVVDVKQVTGSLYVLFYQDANREEHSIQARSTAQYIAKKREQRTK